MCVGYCVGTGIEDRGARTSQRRASGGSQGDQEIRVEREALLTKIEQQDKRIAALENDVKRSEFSTKKTAPVEQRLVDRPVVQGNVPTNTQVQIQEVRRTPPPPPPPIPNTTRRTNYGPNRFHNDRRRHRRCRSNENPWIQVRDKRKPTTLTAAKPQNPGAQPATPKNQTSSGPMNELKGAVRVIMRKCVFFVSGIDEGCDVCLLVNYCRNKKVRVSSCRFLRSRIFGIRSARLCVVEADAAAANMSSAEFWPENISARPWKFDDLPQSSEWMETSSVLANSSKINPIQTSAINPDHITKGHVNVNCLVHKIHNREVKRTHETRRVRVRPESVVKHSWREEKRLSHSWRVADEYDVKKSRWQGACLYRLDVIFFPVRLEAYHEELNVQEEMFLLTLAVDKDETAEIDRKIRRRGDVEPPYVRFHLKDSDEECRVTITIPFFARRKQVPQSAWSKKKEKKKTDVQNWKKVKR